MASIMYFVVILGLLVLVHEFGHFWAARRGNIGVEEFGLGFPPRLWGRRVGSTIYSINLIPFGGFVRLVGENGTTDGQPNSFATAPTKTKVGVLAAGVIMNYLLAWVILSGVFAVGVAVERPDVPHNRYATFTNVRVESFVAAGSAAATAGLTDGANIVAINGQRFTTTDQVLAYTKAQHNPALTVTVRQTNGALQSLTITPPTTIAPGKPVYGFGIVEVGRLRYPWYVGPWYGLASGVRLTGQTLSGLGQLVAQLVRTGHVSQDLSGPIGIAVLTGQVRHLGFTALMQFVAVLSISLAVINFLPLPALDGGRAVFVIAERIRGRQFDPRWEQAIHTAGFYVLLLLVVLVSIRDVQRFDILHRVTTLFR